MRSRSTVAAACAAVAMTTVAALVSAAPALAIDNGVPDGTNHPNVGLLAIEHDGVKDAWCSGFYAGPHKADPGIGVYVTAAHCLADLPALGFGGSDLTVTFEPEVTIDIDGNTWATTAATWHPAFAYDTSPIDDYGVVLLEDPVADVDRGEVPEGPPARRHRRARRAATHDRARQRRLRERSRPSRAARPNSSRPPGACSPPRSSPGSPRPTCTC